MCMYDNALLYNKYAYNERESIGENGKKTIFFVVENRASCIVRFEPKRSLNFE